MNSSPTHELLSHDELNPNSNSTILLIHGAFSSRAGWDLVTPYLPSYHLLVPDLPGHGESQHLPFTIQLSSHLLSELIKAKAHDAKAHIIGLSLGAHVAVNLISRYPEVVDHAFISGFEVFPQTAFSPYMPYALWTTQRIESLIPRSVVRWLMDGADVRSNGGGSLALCRQIANPIASTSWPEPWPAKTLIVAAGKSGILPTADHPHDAIKLMEIGRRMNGETVAVTHDGMRHPWCRQAPLFFAETARAWFEGEGIVSGFRRL